MISLLGEEKKLIMRPCLVIEAKLNLKVTLSGGLSNLKQINLKFIKNQILLLLEKNLFMMPEKQLKRQK